MKIRALPWLLIAFELFQPAHAQIHANNGSNVITGNTGTINIIQQTGITLQEHQKAIELEKKSAEERLRTLYSRKQQSDRTEIEQLKNRIQVLEAQLKSIENEKAILASSLAEYQTRFGSLVSINVRDDDLKKYPSNDRDLIAIEVSEQSKNSVLAEVLSGRDNDRLMRILDILVRDTESMDDNEKAHWKKLLPSMNFEQRFRLLDILATERMKLAALERKYQEEIKSLQENHLKEWEEFQARKKAKDKNSNMSSQIDDIIDMLEQIPTKGSRTPKKAASNIGATQ